MITDPVNLVTETSSFSWERIDLCWWSRTSVLAVFSGGGGSGGASVGVRGSPAILISSSVGHFRD